MARSPMNSETRTKARELFDDGFSRNGIARELDLDPATITRWAKDEDLRFDRSQAALAVRAHTVDLAADRLELAQKMMQVASDMLDDLDGTYLVYSFGGKDNTYEEHTLDRPPVEVIRNAVTTAGIAFDKATRVVEKSSPGLDEAVGMLDTLASGFAAAAATLRAETPADGE